MTSLITGALSKRQICFPKGDAEIEEQFSTQTYSMNDGKVIYSKGNDHIIDAVRCAMLVREEGSDEEDSCFIKMDCMPVLTDPIFEF